MAHISTSGPEVGTFEVAYSHKVQAILLLYRLPSPSQEYVCTSRRARRNHYSPHPDNHMDAVNPSFSVATVSYDPDPPI